MTGKHWREQEDRLLLALGASEPVERLAKWLPGRSVIAIRQRLYHLRTRQIPTRGKHHRDWTEEQIETLRQTVGRRNAEQIAATLGRTPTAVRIKAKKLGLRWVMVTGKQREHPGHTARDVARMLGIACSKTVAWWAAEGWLHATRRPVRYGKHRVWRIEARDLEDFLREYRWLYDPARIVDGGWARFVAGLPSATWVGTDEAARLLCYERGSIAQLCRKGDLAGEHWGSAWRIPVAAIRAFVPPQIGHQGRGSVADELARKREATKAARKTTGWRWKLSTTAFAAD